VFRRRCRRRETRAISTRQCRRIELSASHSKQRFGARATRQFLRGLLAQTSVKTFQMFSLLSHSKQTIEAHNKCQFFAMCEKASFDFRISSFGWPRNNQDAGLPGRNRRDAQGAKGPGATFAPLQREESPFDSLRSKPKMPGFLAETAGTHKARKAPALHLHLYT